MTIRSALLRIVPVAGLALSLSGCLSVPTPRAAGVAWTPPAGERDARDAVWDALRAPAAVPAGPLTLEALIDLALDRNPACRAAWASARAAAATAKQAEGNFLPTLTATAGVSQRHTVAVPDNFDADYLKWGPGVQLNYLVFNFGGGRSAAVEAALQTVYAADYSFNRSLQDAVLAVELAYYGLVSAEAGVAAAATNLIDMQTTLDAAQIRRNAGLGTDLDVLQAQAGVDQARADLVAARGQVTIARGAVAQAIALPADVPVAIVPPVGDLPPIPPESGLRRLVDEAVARRPDIAALRATLAAQRALVTAEGSALWPSLYLTGDAARDLSDVRTGQFQSARDWTCGAGLSLQWTVFDGMQTLNAKRTARAKAEAAEAALRQAELAASADVWTRYQACRTARERCVYTAAYLKSAVAAHDLALQRYKAGIGGVLDTLTAETQAAHARTQVVAARQDAFTALANLAHATGRLATDAVATDRASNHPVSRKDPRP